MELVGNAEIINSLKEKAKMESYVNICLLLDEQERERLMPSAFTHDHTSQSKRQCPYCWYESFTPGFTDKV